VVRWSATKKVTGCCTAQSAGARSEVVQPREDLHSTLGCQRTWDGSIELSARTLTRLADYRLALLRLAIVYKFLTTA